MRSASSREARSGSALLGARLLRLVAAALVVGATAASVGCDPDDGDERPTWGHVFTELPAALLGVWGTSDGDVWTVGADVGDGPWVLRWDGTRWRRLSTGQRGTLWWVHAGAERVWMAGEGGLVLRYDRADDRFNRVEGVPASVTLYGIYEVLGGGVWAVGGTSAGGRVFRLDGASFVEEVVPGDAASPGRFFKVWGRSDTDLWVVGVGGKTLHRGVGAWQVFDTPRGGRLTTVHGNAGLTVAVGGFTEGLVVELSPTAGPGDASPAGVGPLNGVWVDAGGNVMAVGAAGIVFERRGTVWRQPSGVPASLDDYHAVYVTPTGEVWAVGGMLVVEPQRRGMLLRYGLPVSRTIE